MSLQYGWQIMDATGRVVTDTSAIMCRRLLCTENPQLGWGFRKAFSFEPVIKALLIR